MAYEIKGRKTEHAGAKHGCGAFWGTKREAKTGSDTERRRVDRRAAVSGELDSWDDWLADLLWEEWWNDDDW